MVPLLKPMVFKFYFEVNTYIGMSESTGKDGNTINSEHIRCRGTQTSCIQYKANRDNIIVLDIYKNLYKGEVI